MLPLLLPGDLPDPGIEPASHVSCISRQVLYDLAPTGKQTFTNSYLPLVPPFAALET